MRKPYTGVKKWLALLGLTLFNLILFIGLIISAQFIILFMIFTPGNKFNEVFADFIYVLKKNLKKS